MPDKAFNLSNSLRAKKAADNNYLVGYGWNEMGGGGVMPKIKSLLKVKESFGPRLRYG